MKKQYAVFGLGSFGESVAIELQKLGCEVVAIDANMERVEAIANQVSYAMKADIEDADFIRSLGTRNLDGVVVAASDNMEASIMATLVCKEIGVPYVMATAIWKIAYFIFHGKSAPKGTKFSRTYFQSNPNFRKLF